MKMAVAKAFGFEDDGLGGENSLARVLAEHAVSPEFIDENRLATNFTSPSLRQAGRLWVTSFFVVDVDFR
jgi:hypothetical protein